MPKSLTKVWCFSGLNSHRGEVRLWQGRIWRTSITYTTSTSLMFLSTMLWMRVCSAISSSDEDQFGPFSIQEVSRIGAPDLNSGAAAQVVSRGFVT